MQNIRLNSSLIQVTPKIPSNEKQNIENLQFHQESFESLLNNISHSELQFSKHASMRLKSRDIQISNEQMKRIENGILKAKAKGIKDSLVLVDNIALVVNTRKNVVITAMKQEQENVYTNIDGAVIV